MKTQMLYRHWTKHNKKYGNYTKLQHECTSSAALTYYRDDKVTQCTILIHPGIPRAKVIYVTSCLFDDALTLLYFRIGRIN